MFKYFAKQKEQRLREERKAYEIKQRKAREEHRRDREERRKDYEQTTERLKGQEVCFNCKYADFHSMSLRVDCKRYPPDCRGKHPFVDEESSCGEFVRKTNKETE